MAKIERVIKACKYAIGDMIKRGSCYFASTDEDGYRYAISWVEVIKSLDKITELQELNKGLSESYTSNPMYEIGYKKGASDMEKAKQIIIDKLQEQIPKWHYVADGELPKDGQWCLAIFQEVDTGFYIELPYIADYLNGKHTKYTTDDGWIICGFTDREDSSAEYYKKLGCIAWMQLPKFEEVE